MDIAELRVSKDNQLIEARLADFKMSAAQNRIVAWMAAQVHSRKDDDFSEIKTTVNQLNQITKHNYTRDELEWDLRDLRKATAIIRNGSESIICGIMNSARIDVDSGEVVLRLGEEMKPYLLKLGEGQQGFTSYMLDAFLEIKSASSQRLFELLSQWKRVGEKTYEIDDLKRKLGLATEVKKDTWEYNYPQWRDFERRVLRQAECDLCNAGMHMFYHPKKTGRKITHITFTMFSNRQNIEDIKSQYKQLFMYDLTDYERMRIAYTNKPQVINLSIIDYDKSKDISVLKALLPKSRADFYKKYESLQKWIMREQAVKSKDSELF